MMGYLLKLVAIVVSKVFPKNNFVTAAAAAAEAKIDDSIERNRLRVALKSNL